MTFLAMIIIPLIYEKSELVLYTLQIKIVLATRLRILGLESVPKPKFNHSNRWAKTRKKSEPSNNFTLTVNNYIYINVLKITYICNCKIRYQSVFSNSSHLLVANWSSYILSHQNFKTCLLIRKLRILRRCREVRG